MPYKDKEKQREAQARLNKARRKYARAIINEAKAGGCFFCGEEEEVCLDFHHRNPAEKSFTIGNQVHLAPERIIAELAKCVVLCANCHRKLHAGLLSI